MSADAQPAANPRPRSQRVLACVLCQQRKIKCDRRFPCANCSKSQAQCVPATLAQRRRKRRSPEQVLLQRLQKYEELLRQNDIQFDSISEDTGIKHETLHVEREDDSEDDHQANARSEVSATPTTSKSENDYEVKNIWRAMGQSLRDPGNDSDYSSDDIRETTFKQAWDQTAKEDDHLLFGLCRTNVDLSTLHPDPIRIFKLWQIYLDNVNPLLKVTHTPSLQARIIESAGNIASIRPELEALLFSIYCMAILSLTPEECQIMFGSSQDDLLRSYQYGCQQALLDCAFLRTSDRDCLTALYLYLITVRPSTTPQSLSSFLGIAIRIAQRMGLHNEATLAKRAAFEAEMGRRLWWSLVYFDTRIGEMAQSKPTILDPTWDCKVPLNVNDTDLRPEMNSPPASQESLTETLFVVLRSTMGDFIRHCAFHLDFTSPALKSIAKYSQGDAASDGSQLAKLEEAIEDQYIRYIDPENPLHFMTLWTTRIYLARYRLVEHYSRQFNSAMRQTEAQRDLALSYALTMLECNTKLMTSPLTRRFQWSQKFHFPLPAYIHIVQDLRKRPLSGQARQAWVIMSDNYESQSGLRSGQSKISLFFQIFAKTILLAWSAYEATSKQFGEISTPPRIVVSVRQTLAHMAQLADTSNREQPSMTQDTELDKLLGSVPPNFAGQDLSYGIDRQGEYSMLGSEVYSGMSEPISFDSYMDGSDWNAFGGQPGWSV